MKNENEIRAELADLYVAKFPKLGLAENKHALNVLVDIKFKEIKETILEHQEMCNQSAFLEQQHWLGAVKFLESLGALPPPADDLPF